jgi:hypothetical protein
MKTFWPWHYAGLEPLNKKRGDWKRRYAAAFQLVPYDGISAEAPPASESTSVCGDAPLHHAMVDATEV